MVEKKAQGETKAVPLSVSRQQLHFIADFVAMPRRHSGTRKPKMNTGGMLAVEELRGDISRSPRYFPVKDCQSNARLIDFSSVGVNRFDSPPIFNAPPKLSQHLRSFNLKRLDAGTRFFENLISRSNRRLPYTLSNEVKLALFPVATPFNKTPSIL